jgi:hypothetical protein
MKIYALVLGLLLVVAPAFAADVDGNWAGSVDTPNGAVQIGFMFKADGDTLAGSMTGPDGTPFTIKDGKIDGNKIVFSVDLNFGGNAFTLDYAGVVSPDEIKMATDFNGMPFEFTVKKAK